MINNPIVRKIVGFFSNNLFYPIWQYLHKVILGLMGFGYPNNGETNVIKHLNSFYNDNITFFDIGFNTGEYSKEISKVFGKKVYIYGFEPAKNTYKVGINNTSNIKNLKVYNIGLGEEEKKETIYYENELDGTASIVLNNSINNYSKSEEIEITTIDNFCKKNDIYKINFMKIDVEGYELNVLKGAKEMLKNNHIEIIQFEFFNTNIYNKVFFLDFWKLLNDQYKFYRILNNSLVEIKEYSHINCEIFIATNYLLVNKTINFSF